jgi:DNA-binding NarL/FixJ family response regulator
MSLTLVLADDHHIVRQGLRALLKTVPDFELVGETADGREVLRLVERLHPDVLVLDLMMPGLSGLEVTRRVSHRGLKTQVVILSMHANEAYVVEALRSGATAYILKEADADELVRGIREAAAGRRYLSPPLSERTIEAYLRKTEAAAMDALQTLTNREREIMQLAAEGHTSAEIAKRLFISPRTVETHRANLMRKLGVRNHAELIHYAIRRGMVPMAQEGGDKT